MGLFGDMKKEIGGIVGADVIVMVYSCAMFRQVNITKILLQMLGKSKLEDYKVLQLIGKGSFGEILLVEKELCQFAMKKISQKQIIKVNKMHEPFVEREILFKFRQIAPDYFVNLYQTHSDSDYIYMIMEYCDGGSMEHLIKHLNQIENKNAVIKRIIVKMLLILEVMHKNGVIHRDLKPSNFLFKKDGTLKLADFGTAYAKEEFYTPQIAKTIAEYRQMSKKKQNEKSSEGDDDCLTDSSSRRSTFVGTPLYMAPELLQQDFCGPQSDLWALGCIIYELIHLKPPFYDENQGMVWKKILSDDFAKNIKVKESGDKELAHHESLIRSLLVKERLKRLGYGEFGYENIKNHPFFQGIDWQMQKNRPIKQIAGYFEKKKKNEILKEVNVKSEPKILFSGAVSKKMYFGNFKERMLVLHSPPRLVYYDMETGQKKGEIELTKDTPIGTEGSKIFTVTTSKKTYYFKSIKASEWVEMMKFAVITAFY